MSGQGYYLIDTVVNRQLYEEMMVRQVMAYAGIQMNKNVAIVQQMIHDMPVSQVINLSELDRDVSLKQFTLYVKHMPKNSQIEKLLQMGLKRVVSGSQFFAKISPRSGSFDSEIWLRDYSEARYQLESAHAALYVLRVDREDSFIAELDGGMTGSHRMLLMATKKMTSKELLNYDVDFPRKYTTHPGFFLDHVRTEKVAIVQGSDTRFIAGYIQKKGKTYLVVDTKKAKNGWCIYDALPKTKE